jgi:hypothetical protein
VKSPRSMYSVRGTTKVATKAYNVVGVVDSYSEEAKTFSTGGETMEVDELEMDSGGDTRSTCLSKREG